MANKVRIGKRWVGEGEPCFVTAEIGINHNGDIDIARKLISAAMLAGCDAVKFQKRTVEIVYTESELAKPRESPFGATNGDLKRAIEFGYDKYKIIDEYCKTSNVIWYASCWDEPSVDFIKQFNPPCYKIASASLTDDDLLRYTRSQGRPVILSTGMSTIEQVDHAVDILGTKDLIILHCNSSYPAKSDELNLKMIAMFKKRYNIPVGYSGHEIGLATTTAAVVLGASMIERHITLDRAMWGSDQAASVEPHGFTRLVRDIHVIESAMGDGAKRVYDGETAVLKKLRRK